MIRGVLRPIEEVRQEWEREKVYCVAPRALPASLHLLVKGMQMTQTPEQAKPFLDRMQELLEMAWPTSTPRGMEMVSHKGFQIIVPK